MEVCTRAAHLEQGREEQAERTDDGKDLVQPFEFAHDGRALCER